MHLGMSLTRRRQRVNHDVAVEQASSLCVKLAWCFYLLSHASPAGNFQASWRQLQGQIRPADVKPLKAPSAGGISDCLDSMRVRRNLDDSGNHFEQVRSYNLTLKSVSVVTGGWTHQHPCPRSFKTKFSNQKRSLCFSYAHRRRSLRARPIAIIFGT